MSDLVSRGVVTEHNANKPSDVSADLPEFETMKLDIQRRFCLAGEGVASKALHAAILSFLKQREK